MPNQSREPELEARPLTDEELERYVRDVPGFRAAYESGLAFWEGQCANHREILGVELLQRLAVNVPATKREIEERVSVWGVDGPHITYAFILMPHLRHLLASEKHDDELRQIFCFIETLANDQDPDVQGVVQVTICDDLSRSADLLTRARTFMGPATLSRLDELLQFYAEHAE